MYCPHSELSVLSLEILSIGRSYPTVVCGTPDFSPLQDLRAVEIKEDQPNEKSIDYLF